MATPNSNYHAYPYIVWEFSIDRVWTPYGFDDLSEAMDFAIDNDEYTVLTKVADWAVSFGEGWETE